MIRRAFRQVGSVAVASFLWQHRGSVVRAADLARRLPQLLSSGKSDEAVTEAKVIVALDGKVPTNTGVRITGIDDGAVTLRGDVPAEFIEPARQAVLSVSEVLDLRTDAGNQPTLDDALESTQP